MKRILISIVLLLLMSGCNQDTTTKYVVNFDSNNYTVVESVFVDSWDSVLDPGIPIKEGHTFAGWYSDASLNHAYDLINPITDHLTLYAKWEVNQYTITFLNDNGSVFCEREFDYGYYFARTIITNPLKEGFTFSEWDGLPNTMPAQDVTVTATYSIVTYTLQYLKYDSTIIISEEFVYNEDLEDFDIPQNTCTTGYTFSGWDAVLPNTMPAHDITMTEICTANTYTIQYLNNDGSIFLEEHYDFGTEIDIVTSEIPTKDEYAFSGWDGLPNIMPDHNLTVTPLYMLILTEFSSSSGIGEGFGRMWQTVGDYMVVSAYEFNEDQGAVYIYKFSDTSYERKIIGSDTVSGDEFGRSILIEGDYIFVLLRHYNEDQGAVFVYRFSDPSFERKIIGSDTVSGDEFGKSTQIKGDYIYVNSNSFNDGWEAVYVYKISDPLFERKITESESEAGDSFGGNIYIEGDYIIVKAVYHNDYRGAVYVYKISDLLYERKILSNSSWFSGGYRVEVSEDYLFVVSGEYNDGQGAIDVYKLSDPTYERRITGSNSVPGDRFGSSMQIEGDNIIVVCQGDEYHDPREGKVYIYKISDPTYERKLLGSDTLADDLFGARVHVEGDYIFISASYHNDRRGAVYIYKFSDTSYERKITGINSSPYDSEESELGDCFGYNIQIEGDNIFISAMHGSYFSAKIYLYKISDSTYERVFVYFEKIIYPDQEILSGPKTDLFVVGDYVFIEDIRDSWQNIIYVYKISDPTYERIINLESGYSEYRMCIEEDYIFILLISDTKIYVLDISN